jgi:hypothetical protein
VTVTVLVTVCYAKSFVTVTVTVTVCYAKSFMTATVCYTKSFMTATVTVTRDRDLDRARFKFCTSYTQENDNLISVVHKCLAGVVEDEEHSHDG